MGGKGIYAPLRVEPEERLADVMYTMTIQQTADYCRERYGVDQTQQQIIDGINGIMDVYYRTKAECKPGAERLLRALAAHGIPMAIASVTDKDLVRAALEHNGIAGYFTGISTTTEVGAGKQHPDVYLAAAAMIGAAPGECVVFEDAPHGLKTARGAGFLTAAMADEAGEEKAALMRSLSDYFLRSLTDFPVEEL